MITKFHNHTNEELLREVEANHPHLTPDLKELVQRFEDAAYQNAQMADKHLRKFVTPLRPR